MAMAFQCKSSSSAKAAVIRRILITCLLFLAVIHRPFAQYIAEVQEYRPAPGQHVNALPWGVPASAQSLPGSVNGSLSLGAFGGYVVFRFETPVVNHPHNPYGVDFTIFGNPLPGLSEPGIVSVMKDENKNGLPDDTWYELAGSDHWFSCTKRDYSVTYFNPGGNSAADVPWTDQDGGSGFIHANATHAQPYYPLADSFPSIHPVEYLLTGTRISGGIDRSNPAMVMSHPRAFGYADNRPRGMLPYTKPDNPYTREIENAGGDAFDIAWAIDGSGNYVDLDSIHFVKVHTGMLAGMGWLGEISTEITGAVAVTPDSSISGLTKMVVIKDIPPLIDTTQLQLEAYAFSMGRLMPAADIIWETNMEEATVSADGLLTVSASGSLEIMAALADDPDVFAIVSTVVELPAAINGPPEYAYPGIYPNPAGERVYIDGLPGARVQFYTSKGILQIDLRMQDKHNGIDISGLKPGLYVLRLFHGGQTHSLKLIKY
jgi:hypothetical protein